MMKELLEQLLKDALPEEAREQLATSLQEAFDAAVNAKSEENRKELVIEFATQFTADREALVEAVEAKLNQQVSESFAALDHDYSDYRDLEKDYEVKLAIGINEAREEMAATVANDFKALIEGIDSFIDTRVAAEMGELRTELNEAKQNQMGLRLIEAVRKEISLDEEVKAGGDKVRKELEDTKKEVEDKDKALKESQEVISQLQRKITMESLLAPLHGTNRTIMEAILSKVETENLQESFEEFVPRVLMEGIALSSSEKESGKADEPSQVLAESKQDEGKKEPAGVAVTGDDEEAKKLNESVDAALNAPKADPAKAQFLADMRKLSGIK
jgi:hypothetical protein